MARATGDAVPADGRPGRARPRWRRAAGRALRGAVACTLLLAGMATGRPAPAQVLVDDTSIRLLREAIFAGVKSQVGNLPIPSAGAITFQFDPVLGVPVQAAEELGPVFTERAETTGRGKLTITSSYTRYTFDEADGVPLDTGAFKFLILGIADSAIRLNLIELREKVRVEVLALGAVYGVTDRLDVGISVPVVRVSIKERFQRTAFFDCPADFREDLSDCVQSPADDRLRPNDVESTGFGDIALRAKYGLLRSHPWRGGRVSVAVGLDVKLPTGDEGDRLPEADAGFFVDPSGGVGDSGFTLGNPPRGGVVRVRPSVIASATRGGFAPHVNLGLELGEARGITNDLVWAVGFDYSPLPGLTLVADVIGRHAFDEKRARVTPAGPAGTASADTISGALGIKLNPIADLVLFAGALVPLNNTGVRDDLAVTGGLEWSF